MGLLGPVLGNSLSTPYPDAEEDALLGKSLSMPYPDDEGVDLLALPCGIPARMNGWSRSSWIILGNPLEPTPSLDSPDPDDYFLDFDLAAANFHFEAACAVAQGIIMCCFGKLRFRY